ncbi:MAG: carbohydrate-binding domain-containing protein [Sedimentisphaerales bacterium]|nr:carbohydrate-binding domain-containing protein [Sedimentisphaerales bacterium]
MRRVAAAFIVLGLLQAIPSYSQVPGEGLAVDTDANETTAVDPSHENAKDHEDPEDYIWNSSEVVEITLNEAAIGIRGAGATVNGSRVTITHGGTYRVSGVLADGQIVVNSESKKTVRLILDGADIYCSWSAPILVENAKKTVIVLAEDSNNYLADGRSSVVGDTETEEPNAVIFSRDDLTIWGTGSLAVYGNVNDGISSKDGLIIAGGTIDIEAVDDGIRGRDYLIVRGGTITVKAGGDGLKSDNEEDATMGYISIESGTIHVTSRADAIQAETDVLIAGGEITSTAGGGSANTRVITDPSAKGITAGVCVAIDAGSLTIDSADDAIHSNGSLAIHGGTFVVYSIDDAIHSDSTVDINNADIRVSRCYEGIESNMITVDGGDIRIVSTDDGIVAGQSLAIANGVLKITSGADAIAAQAEVWIGGGQITLTSGGGSNVTIAATLSAKGIKGVGSVVIDGGDFTVNSADDAIHSNGDVTINGGTFVLSSGDDGIHADADLVINGGDLRIAKSYEGLESTHASITLNGGTVHITSSDDGINVSAGGDMMGMAGPGGMPGGRPGQAAVTPGATAGDYWLYINGGYLYIDAMGDGIDSNGSIAMTAGTVIVNGPTASNNGALDHSSFPMTGGFIVAAGSSGMAQTTSTTSTQYSILLTFNSTLPAGTLVHIQSSAGENILSFVPTKQYSSVAFSSEKLVKGSTYDVYYGGSSTGTLCDGLYQDGTYTPGTKYTSFTISSTVTNVGTGAAGPGGGGGAVTPPAPRR